MYKPWNRMFCLFDKMWFRRTRSWMRRSSSAVGPQKCLPPIHPSHWMRRHRKQRPMKFWRTRQAPLRLLTAWLTRQPTQPLLRVIRPLKWWLLLPLNRQRLLRIKAWTKTGRRLFNPSMRPNRQRHWPQIKPSKMKKTRT